MIDAPEPGARLAGWLDGAWPELGDRLRRHGAVLLRGFAVGDLETFRAGVLAATPDLLDYEEPSTPRTEVGNRVFTSTEYPADQRIPLHNEASYRRSWPRYLWFWCHTAAPVGGATPLADYRRVYARLPQPVRAAFAERGVRYERRYNTGFDLTWQQVFRTDDRAQVEARLRQEGVWFSWGDADQLHTRQTVEAVLTHPETGERAWFNQVNLFHPAALAPQVRTALETALGPDGLPRTVRYGDGTPIDDDVIAGIQAVIESETVRRPWQPGEVLLVDNLTVAHGRESFTGPRKVYVAMAGVMHATHRA